jgi:hypothetical protein
MAIVIQMYAHFNPHLVEIKKELNSNIWAIVTAKHLLWMSGSTIISIQVIPVK